MLETELRRTILLALAEDKAGKDITSEACVPAGTLSQAYLTLKKPARIAGLIALPMLCEALDPTLTFELRAQEGSDYAEGTLLATIAGNAQSLLAGERTLLNLIQHASAVATLTAQYVRAIEGFCCDILDTRKTLPGLRAMQKYAVAMGGGK